MQTKIKYLGFQRNGVHGEPFYYCVAEVTDDIKREMVITFTATDDDRNIITSSVRVVCLAEINTAWRGDEIGYFLETQLRKEMKAKRGTIYDCCNSKSLYTI